MAGIKQSHSKNLKRRTAVPGDRRNKKQASTTQFKEGSNDEVLLFDVDSLLARHSISTTDDIEIPPYTAPEKFSEIEVEIKEISSTGDGLALSEHSNHVYVVPFTAPGDVVKVKVIRSNEQQRHTITDFLSVVKPSSFRDDSRIKCPYFARCSGCQFQMMDYKDQLRHKKTILERAYKNFSNLAPEVIPGVGDTIGSPLEYGYRTKLTPHFDGPPGGRRSRREGGPPQWKEVPPIGFMQKGTRRTIDIEDCPIGTDAVRQGMKDERARVSREIHKYKRGATILLRESTTRTPSSHSSTDSTSPSYTETKTCISDQTATATEYVGNYLFTNPAGSFFQNNNSILPRFTQYIREHILRSLSPQSDSNAPFVDPSASPSSPDQPTITHLLDAYSGSGLFTITLSTLFKTSTGIDISPQSIAYASKNAELNKLSNTNFKAATASTVFAGLDINPDETAVVIDPPRKGCDGEFLRLLLEFAPRRVVYVSCNVHTQARDVGVLVEGREVDEVNKADGADSKVTVEGDDAESREMGASENATLKKRVRYRIESLQGFDFFPQTGHVEGVAVLERVD
ncbi:MAG: tRNA(m5U54)methyltransferase [Stictis urceolatum]|nr:tRNA(m5U54)methyltransferase [Stictis urceolata]